MQNHSISTSDSLFQRAQNLIPGGVNSPVRAFRAVGGHPIFMKSAKGAYLTDEDNNQYIDMISGSVIEKFTRRLTGVTADELRFGGYVTDRKLGLLRRVREGKVLQTWTPRHPQYDFPLHVGKTWSAVGVVDNDRLTAEHTFSFKVVRQEQILVPAGVFDTLRVEGTSKYKSKLKKEGASGEGTSTYRIWFSPVTGHFVAYEYEETNFKGVVHKKERTELLSYKRDGTG